MYIGYWTLNKYYYYYFNIPSKYIFRELQVLPFYNLVQYQVVQTVDPRNDAHLFNCTAYPTALTPENLWNRPVNTIRELDPENWNNDVDG